MANDALLAAPGAWPRFREGDELCGHDPNPFFVRGRDGRYVDLARDVGLGEPQVSRGIALADVDGDGDLDFAVANQWETSFFYRNECPDPGAFLGLHLLLPLEAGSPGATVTRRGHPDAEVRGRPAIGATASVLLPDGHKLVAQVDGGNGHSGKRSADLHFGLGRTSRHSKVSVDLRWRDLNGKVREERFELTPGWHTIELGWPAEGNEGSR